MQNHAVHKRAPGFKNANTCKLIQLRCLARLRRGKSFDRAAAARPPVRRCARVHATVAMGGSGWPMETMDGTGAGITADADGVLASTGAEDAGARLTRVFILPAAAFINAATMPSGFAGFAGDSAAAGAAPTLALSLRGLIPLVFFEGDSAVGAAAGASAALGAAATGSGPLGTG